MSELATSEIRHVTFGQASVCLVRDGADGQLEGYYRREKSNPE